MATKQFWQFSPEALCQSLQVRPDEGLSSDEAFKRLKASNHSAFFKRKRVVWLKLLISQFNQPFIYLLLICAFLSLFLNENTDSIIIFGIVLMSGFLSFFQEKSALTAVNQLLDIVRIKATALRDGKRKSIPIENIVNGDVIFLNAGSIIPGDCLLLESKDLFVDEASLTGETFYVEKLCEQIPENAVLSKRINSLFMGTYVVSGSAKALVVNTCQDTEFGSIAQTLSSKKQETEFELRIRQFSTFLIQVTFTMLIIILSVNLFTNRPLLQSLLFALALAVGLTPQLLPAIVSINLAHGAKRMAKKRVIVKRLASIENFGSMTILCCDKTGTLTVGTIKMKEALNSDGSPSERVCFFACLNAIMQTGYKNPIDKTLLEKAPPECAKWSLLDEIPYDFIRKRITLFVKKEEVSYIISKGAFQQILDICDKVESADGSLVEINTIKESLIEKFVSYSEDGFRVLGVSYKIPKAISSLQKEDENQMIFLGFLLFADTPKQNIKRDIDALSNLGINVKIITGDNKQMALHLASILNISPDKVLTGMEIRKMSDHALNTVVKQKAIFAEIEPNQKERLILSFRRQGDIVGYLGDGINDVAALHAADVSISVDTAADIAKEAADVVLLEKDLSVLQEGVKMGRVTLANTLKYIFMATSANFGNMFSMAAASLFLNFLPLLPKQVLLTNLMEDFPEMSIATDNVDSEWVQKPLKWSIPFIRKFMLVFGCISSCFDFAMFGILHYLDATIAQFRTGWFVESVVSAAFIVLIIRTFKPFFHSMPSTTLLLSVFSIILFAILLPFLPFAEALGFTPIPFIFYLIIFFLLLLYALTVESAKQIFLKRWLRYLS